ncbi:MAG: sortase [Oscillochloridaceae bacterium umkhey_bin13]
MLLPKITYSQTRPEPAPGWPRLYWTLGNLLFFSGIYLLLYVGGVYAYADFMRFAARGDSGIDLPRSALVRQPTTREAPALSAPLTTLNQPLPNPVLGEPTPLLPNEGQIASAPPPPMPTRATVERVMLPSIKVDSQVVEVGWDLIEQDGQQVAVWQVAEFAVGQHQGSANPGEGGNIVLAGHVGGYGFVFRDLYWLQPGDPVTLYSEGQAYQYVVTERIVVLEEGAPLEERIANAQLIGPTNHEVVTMVTCWPATGPDKFSQRVIVRAEPAL